jgi:tetratricopeptide (TPR) repeat protein
MKIFSLLSPLPALATGTPLETPVTLISLSWPSFHFWPKWLTWNRTAKVKPAPKVELPPVEPLSQHSLMVNAARQYVARNYAVALAYYRRALAVNPNDLAARSGEAWSLYYMGQEELAAKDFQAILKVDANDSWAREGFELCTHGYSSVSNPARA